MRIAAQSIHPTRTEPNCESSCDTSKIDVVRRGVRGCALQQVEPYSLCVHCSHHSRVWCAEYDMSSGSGWSDSNRPANGTPNISADTRPDNARECRNTMAVARSKAKRLFKRKSVARTVELWVRARTLPLSVTSRKRIKCAMHPRRYSLNYCHGPC